jgi:hypothetical protein
MDELGLYVVLFYTGIYNVMSLMDLYVKKALAFLNHNKQMNCGALRSLILHWKAGHFASFAEKKS